MSPEQARGGDVTARSDVYSLGVIAYRMLAGREPFTGSATEVLEAHVTAAPVPLRDVRPGVPEDAADLIMTALAKNPAARPASAGAFGNMLAGQLEPPATFLARAVALFVQRLQAFLTLTAACFAPALVWSAALALWSAGHAITPVVPPPQGAALGVVMAILVALVPLGWLAIGVLTLVVLHTIAAPMRPLNVGVMLREYESRIRRWAAAMVPFLWPRVVGFTLLVGTIALMSTVWRPWIRSFGTGLMRLVVALGLLAPSMLAMWWVSRREWAGMQGGLFLIPVMLVEGLGFDAARARSQALSSTSGRLQRTVRTRFLVGFFVLTFGLTILVRAVRLSVRSSPRARR